MSNTVIDCGNCNADHTAFESLVKANFGATVIRTHSLKDTMDALTNEKVALITVNRLLDRDHSEGMDVIKQIKSNPEYADIPIMLVTNFPDHQQLAIDAGCVPGFGKKTLRDPSTLELLTNYLGKE